MTPENTHEKFIWWKETVIGPFSDEQLEKLNWERIEVMVDALLQKDFPRTPPLSEDMKNFPEKPHIFYKETNN